MASSYKLSYFSLKGLGENIRFLLSYGGIEFEDHRISRQDWPKFKLAMPFGQVPVLEFGNKKAHQSAAIARYLAKEFKLAGNNNLEDLEIDGIIDTLVDLGDEISDYFYEENEAIKESRKTTLFNQTLPFYLERLEKIVTENNGHLALGRLTWADFYFASRVETLVGYTYPDLFSNYPNLILVKEKVFALPSIKAWLAKRPADTYLQE